MLKIDSLTSLQGRKLIQQIFLELKYERQLSGFRILIILWRLCTHERDFSKYIKQEVQVAHSLGTLSGTSLWMQEVVNRFYYTSFNSFVYFGAAIILLLVGIRRFSGNVPDAVVIGGIAFESFLLFLMFIIMFFSPAEDEVLNSDEKTEERELLNEVGELSREIAMVAVQLENVVDSLKSINTYQNDMVASLEKIAQAASDSVSPNPEMLSAMKELNQELGLFKERIVELNKSAEAIKVEEIKSQVKIELENIISKRIS